METYSLRPPADPHPFGPPPVEPFPEPDRRDPFER